MATIAIITRYNEKIDWVNYISNDVDKIIIYNKGSNDNYFNIEPPADILSKLSFIKLPNIGRIDHTITYHICENWENLDDIYIFLPASILMCYKKGAYLSMIRKNLKKIKEKYNGFYAPRFHKVELNYNYTIDNYQAEGKCNKNDSLFIKSTFKNFREWKDGIVDTIPMKYLGMRGMFVVCKENIKFIDKQIYLNLLDSLSVGDNIENGHFAERIWAHLFRQKPQSSSSTIL